MKLNSETKTAFNEWEAEIQRNVLESINKVKQAKVISYDSTTNTATIQILARKRNSQSKRYTIAPIYDVPVWIYNTGTFSISPEVKPETLGLLLFFDEEIDDYKINGGLSNPETLRKHDLNDCIFLPGFYPSTLVTGQCSDGITIGKNDGTSSVVLNNAGDVVANTENGSMTINNAGEYSIDTPFGLLGIGESGLSLHNEIAQLDITPDGDISLGTEIAQVEVGHDGHLAVKNDIAFAELEPTGEIRIGNEKCSIGMYPNGLITIGNDNIRIVLPI